MMLKPISDRSEWEAFASARRFAQFPQSFDWGEFRASCGATVRRYFLLGSDQSPIAAIQMEYRARRFGMGYWFAPRGPIFREDLSDDQARSVMMELTSGLLKIPELQKQSLFWRMEPALERSKPEGLLPLSFWWNAALNPASTMVLNLESSEEDLLKGMHEKTRYNIRLAERHGVVVSVAQTESELNAFLDLMDETASRDGFVQHDRAYLKSTAEFLSSHRMGRVRIAKLDDKILAANLEVSYGDTATYLYGASSSEHRNVMAPFALQWNAIREAKALGFRLYDFWGSNPQSKAMPDYKPSWEGITRFKKGFGTRLVNMQGTWDLPLSHWKYIAAFPKKIFRH
jgi:peptidoglycan pentaglycine glycine transferase (the first glycine)